MDLSALSIFALFVLGVIAWYALNRRTDAANSHDIRTKSEKQHELAAEYSRRVQEVLAPYADDREKMLEKKREILKVISMELSRNVFFDHNEIRSLISELAAYEPES